MGIVINHPTKLTADDVFKQLNMGNLSTAHKDPILAGGPVQTERGFVLHTNGSKRWKTTQAISSDICLTTSQDILDDMAHDQGPEHSLIALGYAGWEAGQLEEEIAENAWLTLPAETDILFKTPIEHRASLAAAKLGIDLALIAPDAGHA